MATFSVCFGLCLTLVGLIAALFYLPLFWSTVLMVGLGALLGPIIIDLRRESRDQLRRFTHKPVQYWEGSSRHDGEH